MKVVDVAVGVIKRGQEIYISKRADALHQGGKWEFPGGKQEANETPAQALIRELKEEVGIDVTHVDDYMQIEHDYGDKCVRLHIHLVERFNGEPTHLEGQIGRWAHLAQLTDYAFPAANVDIVKKLQVDFL
ncbi:8-oxo-dGTP diphosphatase [Paraglaciecola mesophila]|uniref:8-oxo-dGTP diphosphatase n=1 Tax=Paraglaciecola mesophila TaxID=197222 RepID=A0A857JM58_9ALTE|nr:8-oxo-dGTP diphosphatase MutT [Paraglaciecola mesophila]QHJ13159.1 8-oxo-dGTP diphosphatase [Paraglaciecola mesophila]